LALSSTGIITFQFQKT